MNAKEKYQRMRNIFRRYEAQNGSRCIINAVVPNWGNSIEHELVKWWVCAAIATGKHVFWGRGGYLFGKNIPTSEDLNHAGGKLVWENDHAGEPMKYITEAGIWETESGTQNDAHLRRIDIVREDGKYIEIETDKERAKRHDKNVDVVLL